MASAWQVAALLKPADAQTSSITSGNFERQTSGAVILAQTLGNLFTSHRSDMETAAMLCAAALSSDVGHALSCL